MPGTHEMHPSHCRRIERQRQKIAGDMVAAAMDDALERMSQVALSVSMRVEDEEARRRTIEAQHASLGPCGIGMSLTEKARIGRVAYSMPVRQGTSSRGLVMLEETLDLDPGSPRAGRERIRTEIIAFATEHGLRRLVQRTDTNDLDRILSRMRPLWGWSRIARDMNVRGTFMIPVADGLLSCKREEVTAARSETRVCTILKTFIGSRNMNQDYRDQWDRLAEAGSLDFTPLSPRIRMPDDRESRLMQHMCDEGLAWEQRREKARDNDDPDREPPRIDLAVERLSPDPSEGVESDRDVLDPTP